jgi:hypothetical protein
VNLRDRYIAQAVKDVRASQDTLIDLFNRMEFYFKRLEQYIEVRPSAAMTDIIVKIMVEVLSILGIVTKEIGQGKFSAFFHVDLSPKVDLRSERFLKKLVGMKDVEDALRRLDGLTQEEARMAAAEVLKIARDIDNKVVGVDGRVKNVDTKVEGIDHVVRGVDHKVGSVIQGELYVQ